MMRYVSLLFAGFFKGGILPLVAFGLLVSINSVCVCVCACACTRVVLLALTPLAYCLTLTHSLTLNVVRA